MITKDVCIALKTAIQPTEHPPRQMALCFHPSGNVSRSPTSRTRDQKHEVKISVNWLIGSQNRLSMEISGHKQAAARDPFSVSPHWLSIRADNKS